MRHHVIPKFVIRRFSDDGRGIWFYRKPNQGGESDIKKVGWKSIFIRKDIYDDETEDRLQVLEGKAAGIVNRIEQEGPQNVTLSASDMLTLCEFLGIQLLRSEKSIHEMTSDEYIDGYVHKTLNVPRPSREKFNEVLLAFIRHMVNGGIREWVDPERPEYGQLTFKNIQIIAIPDTLSASFVVGDSVPLLYSKTPSDLDLHYRNNLVNPNWIKVMPVTPKIAIALCRANAFDAEPADNVVMGVNTTMFNECLAVAASSKDTIQSLLDNSLTRKTREETLEDPPIRFHLGG